MTVNFWNDLYQHININSNTISSAKIHEQHTCNFSTLHIISAYVYSAKTGDIGLAHLFV